MVPASQRTYRVLVVEDDDLFAHTLELVLSGQPGLEIVGRARNGRSGIELAQQLAPDLVIMDVKMPVLDGIEATRRIHEEGLARHVVVLTGSDVEEHDVEAHAAGAVAFLRKTRTADELLGVVQQLRRV